MKGSHYKPDKINGNSSKLIFIALSLTVASTSIAEIKDENSGITYTRTADAHLSEGPVNNYINLGFGKNVNIYKGESTDLALFFAGNATKFKDNHVGISLCLWW